MEVVRLGGMKIFPEQLKIVNVFLLVYYLLMFEYLTVSLIYSFSIPKKWIVYITC